MEGLITKATGSWYQARLNDGERIECRLPGKFRLADGNATNPVAVGDIVKINPQPDNTGIIEDVRERKNKLIRKATHGRKGIQIIAANVDQVLIVQSLHQPAFKTGFTDRLLVCCEAYEIPAVIVLNKTDLQKGEKDVQKLRETEELYSGLGYTFLKTTIHDQSSIARLQHRIKGKMSVMSGPSGTGKTTLMNLMTTGSKHKTGEISRFSNKGKHTTTLARIVELPEQSYIIDTPGIREFGLVGIEPYELSLFFPEMRTLREACRFYNCTHKHEPSCAVKKAVEDGQIAPSRYRGYVNILESIEDELQQSH